MRRQFPFRQIVAAEPHPAQPIACLTFSSEDLLEGKKVVAQGGQRRYMLSFEATTERDLFCLAFSLLGTAGLLAGGRQGKGTVNDNILSPTNPKRLIGAAVAKQIGIRPGVHRRKEAFVSAALERMFEEIDEDGSGELDLEEFCAGLHKLGVSVKMQDAQQLVEDFSDDGDDSVSIWEFKPMVMACLDACERAMVEETNAGRADGEREGPDTWIKGRRVGAKPGYRRKVFGIGPAEEGLVESHVIHPASPFATCWNCASMLLLGYTAILTPFNLAFFWDADPCSTSATIWVDLTVESFFMLDCFMGFFVGAYYQGLYLGNVQEAGLHYLKNEFLFNLVTSIPSSILEYLASQASVCSVSAASESGDVGARRLSSEGYLDVIRIAKPLRIIRLLKILKASKVREIVSYIKLHLHISPAFESTVSMVATLAFLIHLATCAFWVLKQSGDKDVLMGWLHENDADADNTLRIYTIGFYYVTTIFTNVGLDDITSETHEERIYSIISMCVGAFVFANMLAEVSHVMQESQRAHRAKDDELQRVLAFMKDRDVPRQLQTEILFWLKFSLDNALSIEEDQHLMRQLPASLARRLMEAMRRDSLTQIPLLTQLVEQRRYDDEEGSSELSSFLVDLTLLMESRTYYPGTVIWEFFQPVEFYMSINKGKCELKLRDGSILCYMHPEDFLGDFSLFRNEELDDSVGSSSLLGCPGVPIEVVAVENMECSVLTVENFEKILHKYAHGAVVSDIRDFDFQAWIDLTWYTVSGAAGSARSKLKVAQLSPLAESMRAAEEQWIRWERVTHRISNPIAQMLFQKLQMNETGEAHGENQLDAILEKQAAEDAKLAKKAPDPYPEWADKILEKVEDMDEKMEILQQEVMRVSILVQSMEVPDARKVPITRLPNPAVGGIDTASVLLSKTVDIPADTRYDFSAPPPVLEMGGGGGNKALASSNLRGALQRAHRAEQERRRLEEEVRQVEKRRQEQLKKAQVAMNQAKAQAVPWTVAITVVRANSLPKMDVTGFADPYVKLSFDRQEFTTATIKKSVNPAWNEEFRIKVTPGSNDHYDVVFTIFDWDRMGDDEVIGEVRIPVNDFRSRTTEDVAFPVHKVNTDIPVIGKDKQESNLTVSCQLHALPYTYFHL